MSDRRTVLIGMVSTMDNEPRVRREASSLLRLGDRVVALGVRASGDEPRQETLSDGLEVKRIELLDVRAVRLLKRMLRRGRPAAGPGPVASDSTAGVSSSDDSVRVDRLADVRTLVHLAAGFVGFTWHALRSGADVYHAHDAPPAMAFLLVARLRRRPFVYESHEYWMAKLPDQPWSHRLIVAIERAVCRHGDLVLVVNRTIAERMANDYGIDLPTIVINVPLDSAGLPAPVPPAPGEPLRLLYHGIFVPERGIETAIEAVASTPYEVRLTLRGWGELRPTLEAMVARLGVSERVTFAEPVPMTELPAAAVGEHVGLLPFSTKLGYDLALPNKLFEYLAAGAAVAASDLVELRRVVETDGVGRVFDGTVEGLRTEIEWFCDHLDELQSMRERACAAARDRYHWLAQERVLLDAYPGGTRTSGGVR